MDSQSALTMIEISYGQRLISQTILRLRTIFHALKDFLGINHKASTCSELFTNCTAWYADAPSYLIAITCLNVSGKRETSTLGQRHAEAGRARIRMGACAALHEHTVARRLVLYHGINSLRSPSERIMRSIRPADAKIGVNYWSSRVSMMLASNTST